MMLLDWAPSAGALFCLIQYSVTAEAYRRGPSAKYSLGEPATDPAPFIFLHRRQLTPAFTSPYHQGMVHNIADITPNGTATALASSRTPANWVTIAAPSANAADLRVGDSTTSATLGLPIPKGTSVTLWPIADDNYLDLSQIKVYGASGTDKCAVIYGTH